jgi:hypothetical protein
MSIRIGVITQLTWLSAISLLLTCAAFAAAGDAEAATAAEAPAAPAAGGSQPAAGASEQGKSVTPYGQCDPINYLSNLQAVEAGGVPTLKTTWVQAYTSAVDGSGEGRTDYDSWAVSFGTNTLASTSNVSRLQLLFRSTAIYNLYFNFVGLRTNSAGTPVPADLRKEFEDKAKTSPPASASDVALLWKQVASDFAAKAKAAGMDKTKALNIKAAEAAAAAASKGSDASQAIDVANKALAAGAIDCKKPIVNERLNSTDRFYFRKQDLGDEHWHAFLSNGLGFRGLSGGGSTTTVSSGYGTLYFGFGIDGPLYTMASGDSGFMSFEVYGSYTKMNPHEIGTLFSIASPPSGFATVGTEFELALTGAISLKLAYAKGLGGFGKGTLGDMVMTSLSVNTGALKSQ